MSTSTISITPKKEQIMMESDDRELYRSFLIGNIVIAVITLICMAISQSFIAGAAALIVSILCASRCLKLLRATKNKITDIASASLEIDDDMVYCRQATEQGVFEECEIYMDEIDRIVENTNMHEAGFYIYLKKETVKSSIFVDSRQVERDLFYVNGVGYEIEQFRKFYFTLLERFGGVVSNITQEQLSWYKLDERDFVKQQYRPWIFVAHVIVAKIVLAVVGFHVPFLSMT